MPTVIKIKELGLAISKENYSTKISINTLNIEKGLALFDIIKMYNESLVDLENRVNASIIIEAQVRITEDEALSRYMIDLEASVDNNLANINTELTALSTETSALASTVTAVSASVDDLGATITEQAAVYAGYFTNSTLPEIGNIKNVSGVNYQYLGGNLGPLSDGWVIYNNTALGTANQVKGWVATASSLVVNPSTGQVTGWQYGDGSGFSSFFTISASKINLVGETTFISNVVGGINSGTTTINGGQITTNSINANRIVANTITADRIVSDNIAVTNNYIVTGAITAITAFNTSLTTANTNSIGTFTLSNPSGAQMKVLVSGAGRTGVTGAPTATPSGSFGCWVDGVKTFEYGWTPMIQDAKAAVFAIVIPSGVSKVVDVRGCKTDSYTYELLMQFSTLGVRN